MSIRPIAPFFGPSGALVTPAGQVLTYGADYEADLVQRGLATYTAAPDFPGRRVPVEAIPSGSGPVPQVGGIGFSGVRPTIGQQIYGSLVGPVVRDSGLVVIGDSTGNEPDEWVYLYAQRLATVLPDSVRVVYQLYDNNTTFQYGAPILLKTGSGEPAVTVGADKRGWGVAGTDIGTLGADRDIRIEVAPASWNSGAEQTLCAQYGSAGSRAWRIYITAAGNIAFVWTTDGSTNQTPISATNPGWSDGQRMWVRVTIDVDNGASGNTVKIYNSTDGITWTTLKTTTTPGVTSIYSTTAQVYEVGSHGGTGSAPAAVSGTVGTFYNFFVSDVIDGPNKAPSMIREYIETFEMAGVRVGGPCLQIWNGSISGSKMADNLTRIERMCPRLTGCAPVIINSSHNEGATFNGPGYIASLDALLTAIRARIASPRIVLNTQNPKYSPQEPQRIDAQARRSTLIREIAAQRDYDLIDAYPAFGTDASLVKPDGIHPQIGTGSRIWADSAWASCGIST